MSLRPAYSKLLAPQSSTSLNNANSYRGRFAPSPSGPLHFGSLVCALASYLDAKSVSGEWLLRIEDIDTGRTKDGATQSIVETLGIHGLLSDESIVTQSQRLAVYERVIEVLAEQGQVYACDCSRKNIKLRAIHYDGFCSARNLPNEVKHAIRLHNEHGVAMFQDQHQGSVQIPQILANEDFVLRRRDGCYAYNLVVVVDDILQGVTHIVRGADLLETTALQQTLYNIFGAVVPTYCHIPVAATQKGYKLSKQNHAMSIDNKKALLNVQNALVFLGYNATQVFDMLTLESLIAWAIKNWTVAMLPKQTEVLISPNNGVYSAN